MIHNNTGYNPFPAIYELKSQCIEGYTQEFFDLVFKELFKGGVVPENQEEFDSILTTLMDMKVI